jgi:hypothetical protein
VWRLKTSSGAIAGESWRMTDRCDPPALGATAPCPLEDENHDVANVVQP